VSWRSVAHQTASIHVGKGSSSCVVGLDDPFALALDGAAPRSGRCAAHGRAASWPGCAAPGGVGDSEGFAVIGPARFGTAGPYLQVFEWSERPNSLRDGVRVRREYGTEPLASALRSKPAQR
jgi:hypothetical protein